MIISGINLLFDVVWWLVIVSLATSAGFLLLLFFGSRFRREDPLEALWQLPSRDHEPIA